MALLTLMKGELPMANTAPPWPSTMAHAKTLDQGRDNNGPTNECKRSK